MNFTKKTILLAAIICFCKFSNAQFIGSNPITQSSAGNIAVGFPSYIPSALLQVKNGSILFDGTTGNTPISGAGTRMMWVPSKGAFRAGNVTTTNWDDVNIGSFSFACGLNTKASGAEAFACGSQSVSSGIFSFSSGVNGVASGLGSSSFGSASTASGQYSSAFGSISTASGMLSTAFGNNSISQSYNSFVLGRFNVASLAYNATGWIATDPLFVIGNGTSTIATNNALTVLKNGNVLINKATQVNSTYILDVNGKIRASEIVVNTTGADFVFEKNYKLTPLNLLEETIKTDKHLPGIASAAEMQNNGVGLAELNKSLLQKTEELTLYIIDLNKRIEILEKAQNK